MSDSTVSHAGSVAAAVINLHCLQLQEFLRKRGIYEVYMYLHCITDKSVMKFSYDAGFSHANSVMQTLTNELKASQVFFF